MDHNFLNEVYAFWFGNCEPDRFDSHRFRMWMEQSDETDQAIRVRFATLLPTATAFEWDVDALSREEAVALVVLFDQFPRNLYRKSGEAYAYDHLARAIARRLIASGWDRFTLMERVLLGLPFVHHEQLDDQSYALKLASEIVIALPGDHDAKHRMLDQAIRHRDLIRRFGRFPHRNAMLGRTSTPEETAFLAEYGRGF